MLPVNMPIAKADDSRRVTIRNTFENFNHTRKVIEIQDVRIEALINKELTLITDEGEPINPDIDDFGSLILARIDMDEESNIVRAVLSGEELLSGTPGNPEDPPVYNDVNIIYENVNEGSIPVITSLEKSIVDVDEEIIIKGSATLVNLVINAEDYIIMVGSVEAQAEEIIGQTNQVNLIPKNPAQPFTPGTKNISIARERAAVDEDDYTLEVVFVYSNAVRIAGDLALDGMTMFPNAGQPGSDVQFTRQNFNQDYDIYFISDLDNPNLFTVANMATNFRRVQRQDGDDVITVEVPDVAAGPYHIVFTNANSQQSLHSTFVYDQEFTVFRIGNEPRIVSIQPDNAISRNPREVTISGYDFAQHNIPDFNPDADLEDESFEIQNGVIVMDYGTGKLELGGDTYDVSVTRQYTVTIGDKLDIIEFIFDPDDLGAINRFIVKTRNFGLEEEQIHDVVVRMETKIEFIDEDRTDLDIVKEVIEEDGFTYHPSTVVPNVIEVIPSVIPITEDADGDYYIHPSVGDELLIAVKGDNFLVTRYFDENGIERISKPIIRIGGVDINPNLSGSGVYDPIENTYVPLEYEVLKNGVEVAGTPGNEIGDTILIYVKTGLDSATSFPVLSETSRSITIFNPQRGSDIFENQESFEMISFKVISVNDFPRITYVDPSLVTVDGGVPVWITGSNLRPGAKVYIDGKEVTDIEFSGDNQFIAFIAPPGRPGVTQLQIINPEGGIATHPFTYSSTYTEPQLYFINPEEGTTNTLVTMKGESFLRPDPTVVVDDITNIDEFLMYRLIGSRVLMDGHDINKYNRKPNNKIELIPFVEDDFIVRDNVFEYRENIAQLELGSNFNSVLLVDENTNKFYRIIRDVQNNYVIEDGLGNRYTVGYDIDSEVFTAVRASYIYEIEFPQKGEIALIDSEGEIYLSLTAYTPYLIEMVEGYHEITGSKVQYIDSSTLTFTVPVLAGSPWTGPGYYDVTIINPDIKSQTLTDAFRYFSSPMIFPVVKDVRPDQGPDSGGNIITFILDDSNETYKFVDTGNQKTKVFLGSQQVPTGDVEVSFDGREMQVRVPAYDEDIKEKGTDRIIVPIVLVNPDGGTFNISYDKPLHVERENIDTDRVIRGYTYVVPTSNPVIDYISPVEEAASGGYVVEIFGSDFRDFEPFTDINGNFRYDQGEFFTDLDGDGEYTAKAPKDSDYQAPSKYNSDYQILTSVLLPKVYFGNKEAEIVEFNYGYLQVIVPPGVDGSVDVYVINNDAGISNSTTFTYKILKPEITSIVPGEASKYGGDRVEILGNEFAESSITLLRPDYDTETGYSVAEQKNLTMVKVGDRTNKDLPREDENSGVIMSHRATVRLPGGLITQYDGSGDGVLRVSIMLDGKTYTHEYRGVRSEPVFINTTDLLSEGTAYPFEELIRFEIVENRLLVDAGYAPAVEYFGSYHLIVHTPAYYTVGQVNLYVVNPDGSIAQGELEYLNPDSRPYIVNMTMDGRDPVPDDEQDVLVLNLNYRGGNTVSIIGGDFREGAVVQISNIMIIPSDDIYLTYNLPTRLTFTVPEVPEDRVGQLFRVTVINEDGGSASSDEVQPKPIYIKFIKGESFPEVESVTPDKGPAKGGTQVIIVGKDFREDHLGNPPLVFFGEVQIAPHNVTRLDYRTIRVVTPPNVPGPVEVKIENYDGAVSRPSGIFYYISSPTISALVDPDDPTETSLITNISVEGGQSIKLKGAGYEIDSRIVFNPEIKALATGESEDGKNIIYIDGEPYQLLSGVDGTLEEFIDSETMIIETPLGRLNDRGVIVINSDGGATDIYEDISYALPDLTAPHSVAAELVYDRYIRVHWSEVQGAEEYEIFVIVDDQPMEFLVSTKLTSYLYSNLEPRTDYRFVIKAVGNFGSSPPSIESNEVTTGRSVGYPDDDGAINENTQFTRVGQRADVNIGTKDFDDKDIVIDLLRGELAGSNEIVISIPASVIANNRAKDINVIGKDFSIKFNPSAFNNTTVNSNKSRDDAGARFRIAPINENLNVTGGNYLSTPYLLEANIYLGRENIKIDYLRSFINLSMDFDKPKADMRRLDDFKLHMYDENRGIWEPIEYNMYEAGSSTITAVTDRLGRYLIIGSRR